MEDQVSNSVVKELTDIDLLWRLSQCPSATEKEAIWEELYTRYYNYVYINVDHTFKRLYPRIGEVDEVLNDVFLEFFQKLEAKNLFTKIKDPSRTSAYLRSMLKNLIRDKIRILFGKGRFTTGKIFIRPDEEGWKKIMNRAESILQTGREEESAEVLMHEAVFFIRTTVKKHLSGRDEKYKKILAARLEREPRPSFKKIGEEFKITAATARQRYKRGLEKVRRALLEEAEGTLGKGVWHDAMLQGIRRQLRGGKKTKGKTPERKR